MNWPQPNGALFSDRLISSLVKLTWNNRGERTNNQWRGSTYLKCEERIQLLPTFNIGPPDNGCQQRHAKKVQPVENIFEIRAPIRWHSDQLDQIKEINGKTTQHTKNDWLPFYSLRRFELFLADFKEE